MKRFSVLPLLLIAALIVAACGGAVAEAPAEAPVEEAAEAPAEVEEEAMEEEEMEEEAMDEEMASDIVSVAVADGRFTTLAAALEAADLVGALQGEGPFTVFAPTDDAFDALPEGTVAALLADPEALTAVLTYHVVAGQVMAADVVGLESAEALSGEMLTISVDGDAVMINDANVIITDVEASNGVIHVIDTVLLPPSMAEETADIVGVASEAGTFTTLLAAAEAAGLVETLQGEGPFTVFAPTDDAFAALPEGTVAALLEDPEALANILLYHVVPGAVYAEDVVTLAAATTAQGSDVKVTVDGDAVMINNANVIATDIEASNGVIHVIDAVMLPPADIVSVAVEDGRFTTLAAALDAAGLVETLQGEGPFTVFAPTDDAFDALPEGTVEGLLEDPEALADILLYHVVPGKVYAAEVVEMMAAVSAQGSEIEISVTDDGVVLNNSALVIITDVLASNGVIHVIDAVILPPADAGAN